MEGAKKSVIQYRIVRAWKIKSLLSSLCKREGIPLFGRRPIGPPSGAEPGAELGPKGKEGLACLPVGRGEIFGTICLLVDNF